MFVTFIFLFENSQNLFWCGLPFGPFWPVKYLNFGQNLSIRTTHHAFLERRQPEVTKNPYYALSLEWSQKKVFTHGLVGHCAHSCRPPDGNKSFSTKTWKEMTIIFIYVKQMIGKELNQNITVSPICIYLSICLLSTTCYVKRVTGI